MGPVNPGFVNIFAFEDRCVLNGKPDLAHSYDHAMNSHLLALRQSCFHLRYGSEDGCVFIRGIWRRGFLVREIDGFELRGRIVGEADFVASTAETEEPAQPLLMVAPCERRAD